MTITLATLQSIVVRGESQTLEFKNRPTSCTAPG